MMKLLSIACLLGLNAVLLATPLDNLAGNWEGKVELDTKDLDKANLHTPAEAGATAKIEFSKGATGEWIGQLTLGQTSEQWVLEPNKYTFENKEKNHKVFTEKVDGSKIPGWIFDRLPKGISKKFVFYEFRSCKLLDKPQDCVAGLLDLPKGIDSGIWAFARKGNRFWANLYYEYPDTKQKRVLELLFSKKN